MKIVVHTSNGARKHRENTNIILSVFKWW